MSNSLEQSQDAGTLADRVARWLAEQGYPLELQVAHLFQLSGARVFQSEYYADHESNSNREIDVHASYTVESPDYWIYRVAFMAECKVSRDKPWVTFTAKASSLARPVSVVQRSATAIGSDFLHQIAHDPSIQALALFSFLKRQHTV